MDNRCGNCKYKGYENNPNWAFCTCKQAQEVGWEWHKHIQEYQKAFGVSDRIDKTNMCPSCMMVQSGYAELYGKICPHKKESDNE